MKFFYVAKRWRYFLIFFIGALFCSDKLWAIEIAGGFPLPPGGVINSLYLSGSPVGGLTVKARDEEVEYTAFFGGGFGLVSVEYINTLGNEGIFGVLGKEVYTVIGGSLPLALNVGGGFYLAQTDSFGLRLQYVSLVTSGGTILGSNSAGPSVIGWLGLLLSYKL